MIYFSHSCFFVLLFLGRQRIRRYLVGVDRYQSFLFVLGYTYISLIIFNWAVIHKRWFHSPSLTLSIVIFIQILFAFLLFGIDLHIQRSLLTKQKQAAQQKYLTNLEKSEDQVRRFKHDYLNLLVSLRGSAISQGDQQLIAELDKYTQHEINDQSLWKYKNLNHLHNAALKSLVVEKIDQMQHNQTRYQLECARPISVLPPDIKLFDLVRIIGITFDDAVEESKAFKKGIKLGLIWPQ